MGRGSTGVGGVCVAVDALDGGSGVAGGGSVVPGVAGASCADFGPARNRAETFCQTKSATKPKAIATTAAMPRKAIGSFDERLDGHLGADRGWWRGRRSQRRRLQRQLRRRPGGSGGAETAGRDPVGGRAACAASVS